MMLYHDIKIALLTGIFFVCLLTFPAISEAKVFSHATAEKQSKSKQLTAKKNKVALQKKKAPLSRSVHPQSKKAHHAKPLVLSNEEILPFGLRSASALVLDQRDGTPLFEKNATAVVPIASISKLMTAMVVLDAKEDLQEVISIDESDVDLTKGTGSRIPVGATMTRETAMLLALMSSENRAAHALGRHYPGGLTAFVQAMNQKARALGMNNTSFVEPTGLSRSNVSTARDLAKMVFAASQYVEIRRFSTMASASLELRGRVHDFRNTNVLVHSEDWRIGVSKTGYISEAGRCLVMQAEVADKPVIIVLLDSSGKMSRVGDANRIKHWIEKS